VYLILLIVTPVIGFTAICIVKRKILFFWFNVVNISSMVIIFGLSIYLGITVASSVYYIDYFGAYIFIFIFMFILPSGIVLFLTIRYSSYMDENTSDFSEFNTKKLKVYILLIIFSIAAITMFLTVVSQLDMSTSPNSLYNNVTTIANNWNTQDEHEFASLSPITITSQNGYINGTLVINVTQVPNYKWEPYYPKITNAYYYGSINTINVNNIFKLMNFNYTLVLYDNIIFTTSKKSILYSICCYVLVATF